MSSRKVQVYASPGWEVEVDPEWAEGLFAVFLRHAKTKAAGRARGPTRAGRVTEDTDVVLLKIAEEEEERERHRVRVDDTLEIFPRRSKGDTTARRKAAELDEGGSEMSGAELSAFVQEMATLAKYGHPDQVRGEVRKLFKRYPKDLLLRRQVIDFLIGHELVALATEELYGLGAALFEGGDVDGVKQIVAQVLKLDPESARAKRLMKLLSERQGTSPGRSKT